MLDIYVYKDFLMRVFFLIIPNGLARRVFINKKAKGAIIKNP